MRNLGIIPTIGTLKPTDKIPLGSYIQDIEEMHKKTIDPVTGRLFMKYKLQDDLRDKRQRERATLLKKQTDVEGQKESEQRDPVDEMRS